MPHRNKRKNRGEDWSPQTVGHFVWSKLHDLLHDYSPEQERMLREGMKRFIAERLYVVALEIVKERSSDRATNFERAVDAIVPHARVFCQEAFPELRMREYPRPLYG